MRRPLLALCFALTGCLSNLGPRTVRGARFDYNQYIARSSDEQVLLNLVRLRYRDTPFFLEVGTVLVQYEVIGHGALGGTAGFKGSGSSVTAGADVEVAERPTLTYQPLSGDAFAQRLLSPVPIATLAMLAGSGWSVERVLDCCVDAVNGLQNSPAAAGPTPAEVHFDPRFHEMASLLRRLQRLGALEIIRTTDGNETTALRFLPLGVDTGEVATGRRRLRELLNITSPDTTYELAPAGAKLNVPVRVRQRSLLGTMYFLSQVVDVPAADVRAGLVTQAKMPDGSPVDWSAVTGGIFRVRVAESLPPNAFTSVHYRGHWFYIDDADLESKTTFGFLSHLFSLQAVTPRSSGPIVTVPVRP